MMRGTGFTGTGFSGPGVVTFSLTLSGTVPFSCQLVSYTTAGNTGTYAFDVFSTKSNGALVLASSNIPLPKTTSTVTRSFVDDITLFKGVTYVFSASSTWKHASDTQGYIKSITMECANAAPPPPSSECAHAGCRAARMPLACPHCQPYAP